MQTKREITSSKTEGNKLAIPEGARRQHRDTVRHYRDLSRKAEASGLRALGDFANLVDDPRALRKFCRMHPDFEPLELLDGNGKRVRVMQVQFLPAVLAYRDLLRAVWRGQADASDLETLLGLNQAAFGKWVGEGPLVDTWNAGLATIQAAGFCFSPYWPLVRARWESDGSFHYVGQSDFQNSVYALWRKRWRARVCPACESYFIAKKPADRYCSRFCFHEGKNQRNREWWRTRGAEWRKDYLAEKAKAERIARRKRGGE